MELKEVFEPVLNFIKSLQKKDKELASKQAAKDRLKLVLMQDRASVSPDFFELMKKEIIDVIKKYIEIDEESLEVQLTRGLEVGLEGPALYANIPIKNVKPVAPGSESEDDENIMTEQKAEKVAEQILNKIEEAAKKEQILDDENNKIIEDIIKEEIEEAREDSNKKEEVFPVSEVPVEKENEEKIDKIETEVKKEEKVVKKSATKKTTNATTKKSTTKSTAKKTATKAKKETKK